MSLAHGRFFLLNNISSLPKKPKRKDTPMLTITLTKETINYDKLVTYLEENKEHRLKMLNDKNIRDLSYAFDDETLIENIIYWDGMVGKAEYNRLTFENDYDVNVHIPLDEFLKQQIIDMKSYLYILYNEVYDGNKTNIILRGIVTDLNKAKARKKTYSQLYLTESQN